MKPARWLTIAALLVFTLVPLGVQTAIVSKATYLMGDFRAFYCASRVAIERNDPYLEEPLHSCEIGISPQAFVQQHRDVTIPAPLPGYVLAFLAPLTHVPFFLASIAWVAILLAATAIAIGATAALTRCSLGTTIAAFAISLGALSLPYGEIVPIVAAFTALAGLFASRGAWTQAALAASVTMIEPHLGLPVCISLFAFAPRTRIVLATAATACAVLSLIVLGPATTFEYFTRVLPAHALSEVARDSQYSLTAVLSGLGASPAIALRLGSLSYLVAIALGLSLAQQLARRHGEPGFLVVIPPAIALIGGTFIHVTQMAVALPAALLLIRVGAYPRLYAVIAMLLAVPWSSSVSPVLGTAAAFPIAWMAWEFFDRNIYATVLAACAAAALIVGIDLAYAHDVGALSIAHRAVPIDTRLAEASWSRFTFGASSSNDIATWLGRAPTWIALILLLGSLVIPQPEQKAACSATR